MGAAKHRIAEGVGKLGAGRAGFSRAPQRLSKEMSDAATAPSLAQLGNAQAMQGAAPKRWGNAVVCEAWA